MSEQTKLDDEKPKTNAIAHELAKKQREVGIAEFFERNRHLLGFDNKRKALLTCIKEAVDNSLDACEEAGILPEIIVEIIQLKEEHFRVVVEDNGPGIVKKQIPKIFAKLLYGSKFFKLSQTRGQQGIGISAAVMYGQLTTGRHAKILSKIHKDEPANYFELGIDTSKNAADISHESVKEWNKEHGTRIEIDLEASYQGGTQSVDEYLKETAIVNPHATIIYTNPKAEQLIFPRVIDKMPPQPKEIKPHAYGVELGNMIKMLGNTETKTLQHFLTEEFVRIGDGSAKEVCKNAGLLPNTKPQEMSREQAEQLVRGITNTKLMNPPTDCLSPISAELLEKGLRKEINAEFYCASTRPVEVYRGNPFVIEAGLAYGGDQPAEEPVRVLRFANRVPLLYQQGACASSKAIIQTVWRNYGLSQSKGSTPIGPLTISIHIASVWVPFTSESKEAIAHYPEIIKEMKLALQEVGRQLGGYLNKKHRIKAESKKRDYITIFIPYVGQALKELLGLKEAEEKKVEENLVVILEKTRGELEVVEDENLEFDESFAKIGRSEKSEEED